MAKIRKIEINGMLFEQSYYSYSIMPKMSSRQRSERQKLTTIAKQKINARKSKAKLVRYICLNFRSGRDLKIELTHAGDEPDDKTAGKRLSDFHNNMRQAYRKRGAEYKYIAITETHGKDGESTRIHHHLIINALDAEKTLPILLKCWDYGGVNLDVLIESDMYEDTASYFLKEKKEKGKRTWTHSLNLIKPSPPEIDRVSESETIDVPPGISVIEKKDDANQFGCYGYCIGRIIDERAFYKWLKKQQQRRNIRQRGAPLY